MVIYPVFAQYRTIRSSIAANGVPLVARFVGHLMVTVMLAVAIGVVFGTIAGFVVVVALW